MGCFLPGPGGGTWAYDLCAQDVVTWNYDRWASVKAGDDTDPIPRQYPCRSGRLPEEKATKEPTPSGGLRNEMGMVPDFTPGGCHNRETIDQLNEIEPN